MRPPRLPRWPSLAVSALCLLGYAGLFAPSANAGCGGDLVHRPAQPAAQPMTDHGGTPEADPTRPAGPCHGPACQKSQTPPLAPSAPPPSKIQPDAVLTAGPVAEPTRPGAFDRESQAPPSQFPSSVFRPPR